MGAPGRGAQPEQGPRGQQVLGPLSGQPGRSGTETRLLGAGSWIREAEQRGSEWCLGKS